MVHQTAFCATNTRLGLIDTFVTLAAPHFWYTGNNELLASKVRATKAWRAAKKDIPDLGTVKI
tara:strand:- start:141 stop:329 length:189 start_codon:yes stop_codon:yes gene_type:complete